MSYTYKILNSTLNPISQDQCIGDTLDTFNANFSALDTSAFSLSTALISLSGKVNNIQDNDSMYLTADNDSAYVVSTSPSVAKAWVVFDGSSLTIKASYNVTSIIRTPGFTGGYSAGNYKIIYSINLPDTNYAVFATSTDFGNSGYNTALQSYNGSGYPANTYNSSGYKTVSSVNVATWNDNGVYLDDGDISVLIFDN
jgi:hypothetical protein